MPVTQEQITRISSFVKTRGNFFVQRVALLIKEKKTQSIVDDETNVTSVRVV